MPGSLKVPVEVPPEIEGAEDPDQLSVKINQIFLQKGPFRNVTEQSVSQGPDMDDSDTDDDKSDKSDDETREERLELLRKTREELFEIVRRGTLQCNEALDFLSLLLSKHSRAAESTFSQVLKESVKPGMLDGVYLDNARYSSTIRTRQDLSKGWRAKSFLSATEKLQKASKRLKREADSQSSFWDQIAQVGDSGWKLCRLPANRRQIGVMFGMPESAPQFRNQGLVTLQQNDDSSVQLARLPARKYVVVTISRSGQVTGRHCLGEVANEQKRSAIADLKVARDCLLDEELFHELGREARLAANQGIITRGADVEFAINEQFSVRVSFQPALEAPQQSAADDGLARIIGLSLRSLLIQAHHDNHLRRSRPPPPISTKPAHAPEYAILRPLIATIRHNIAKAELEQRLDFEVIAPLVAAGIKIELKQMPVEEPSHKEKSHQHSIMSTQPLQTTYIMCAPHDNLEIKVMSHWGGPVYYVRYEEKEENLSQYETFDSMLAVMLRKIQTRLDTFIDERHEIASSGRAEAEMIATRNQSVPEGQPPGVTAHARYTLHRGTLHAKFSGGGLAKPITTSFTGSSAMHGGGTAEQTESLADFIRKRVHERLPGDIAVDTGELGHQ